MRAPSSKRLMLAAAMLAVAGSARCGAQAALLVEQPYGFFGALNPTGHNAVYLENICADTPTHLRPCQAGESGSVIARYQGVDGFDWVAVPLIPYLYSVETSAQVPRQVDREIVDRLRSRYRERHLQALGAKLGAGNFIHGGWTQLVGAAYERRIYAFRFDTTPAEDHALIARLNAGPNRSHFNLLYSNCSDFARELLNADFPHAFPRRLFPDAGMTTPRQLAWRLERYARRHPEMDLSIWEIPQIPGYRRMSGSNKGVAESLITTAYAIPIAIANPYLAGGLFVDYLARGRYRLVPRNVPLLSPGDLSGLTAAAAPPQTRDSAATSAPAAEDVDPALSQVDQPAAPSQKDRKVNHE